VIRESRLGDTNEEPWPAETAGLNGNGSHPGAKNITGGLSSGIVKDGSLGK